MCIVWSKMLLSSKIGICEFIVKKVHLGFLAFLENKDEKAKLCIHDWCVAAKESRFFFFPCLHIIFEFYSSWFCCCFISCGFFHPLWSLLSHIFKGSINFTVFGAALNEWWWISKNLFYFFMHFSTVNCLSFHELALNLFIKCVCFKTIAYFVTLEIVGKMHAANLGPEEKWRKEKEV